ncbi:DNA repair protein RadA [Patescibacteria group bacterium]|nr:DNA repair protein RadA [Patescibacteria group bacterium]
MKEKTVFVCSSCGTRALRWSGKCEQCEEWNTLEEQTVVSGKNNQPTQKAACKPVLFSDIKSTGLTRFKTDIGELDQVLGGGFVRGSVTLLSGDPGIGKSTLVLQFLSNLSKANTVLYFSGEESAYQVSMRAKRLGAREKNVLFASENDVDSILAMVEVEKPAMVVVDSIQTLQTSDVASSMGSVAQVRESAARLIPYAKAHNIAFVLIGHVTKEGNVAGPKTLEHLVDTVLYLEGDRYHTLRVLRGVKNRFGSTNEAGVFEMAEKGLIEVKNPSELFLAERTEGSTGSVVTAIMEGNRAFLLEVQALTTRTNFGYPKRTASGFDQRRLELLIAVLQKRARLKLEDQDVYVNVVGGFSIKEPAADVPVCLAVASSLLGRPIDDTTLAFGEVGLSGELRSVAQSSNRLKEAEKLGFKTVIVPSRTEVDFSGNAISSQSIADIVKKTLQ